MVGSKGKVALGMSGGIDSSISAYLLSEAGYEVEGFFMKNWEEDDDNGCTSKKDYEDAIKICNKLGIKLNLVNFSDKYWSNVFEKFLAELKKGFTPNPDIFCNKEIKFKLYYDYAMSLGFDYIATGHYAKKLNLTEPQLHIPKDRIKDQTYFLYTLNEKVLKNTIFPLEEMEKNEVKKIEKKLNFGLERKKESMGICFIGNKKFTSFIDRYIKPEEGNIVDYRSKKIIGTHEGLNKYTIGQRKGIKIGGMRDKEELAWYVIDKNIDDNILIVSQDQAPLLYSGEIELNDFNLINKDYKKNNIRARFRHGGQLRACEFKVIDQKYIIRLKESERAIAPGQSAVLYNDTHCIGGGIITSKCLNKI